MVNSAGHRASTAAQADDRAGGAERHSVQAHGEHAAGRGATGDRGRPAPCIQLRAQVSLRRAEDLADSAFRFPASAW